MYAERNGQIELDIDEDDPVSSLTLALCTLQHVSNFEQINRIKEKVEEQSGVPPSQQRLIFSGRQMCVS